jgi:hypothetical protein
MSVAAEATIIMSMGTKVDTRVLANHERSKLHQGPVYSIQLSVDPETDELTADPRELEVLSKIGSIKKIIITGHSSPNGHTLQFDPIPKLNLTVGQRTRHYSEIVRFIAKKLDRSVNNNGRPLKISLLSCCSSIGGKHSLAAKMQRQFELVHDIPCIITARNGYVFIGTPGFVISEPEYAYRLAKQYLSCNSSETQFYRPPKNEEHRYHKVPGAKFRFFSDPATGVQLQQDAYGYNEKFVKKVTNLCALLKAQFSEANPEILDEIQGIEKAMRKMSFSEPTIIKEQVLPRLKKIRQTIHDNSPVLLDSTIAYAEKYIVNAPSPIRLAAPFSEADRANYRTHDQIVADQMAILNTILQFGTVSHDHPELSQIFLESGKGIIDTIATYYKYQLKNGLKVDHIDVLIEKLAIFLSKVSSPYSPIPQGRILKSEEVKAIFEQLSEIEDKSAEEGKARARARGLLNGAAHYREMIKVCTAKRKALCDAIRTQLEKLAAAE